MRQTVVVPHGGDWTQDKLVRLRKYLEAYMTIFKGNPNARYFQTTYVDAFAGTGYSQPKTKKEKSDSSTIPLFEVTEPEAAGFLKGSARIALEVQPRFDKYLFIEQKAAHYQALEGLKEEFPTLAPDLNIVKEDANTYLTAWCNTTDWSKNRAVVFLDPFGMEVKWSLLQTIARTKSIDLWLLFPLGGINRHLTRDDVPPPEWTNRLSDVLGTNDWLEEFYSIPQPADTVQQLALFEAETAKNQAVVPVKEVDSKRLGDYFVSRLETIFPGVANNPLTLRNSRNSPMFLLCFATANPKETVKKAALRIAKHLLKE